MSAKQKVREMLKEIMPAGEANACQIWRGYSPSTLETGWHYQKFGRGEAHYIGKSLAEAQEYVRECLASLEAPMLGALAQEALGNWDLDEMSDGEVAVLRYFAAEKQDESLPLGTGYRDIWDQMAELVSATAATWTQ